MAFELTSPAFKAGDTIPAKHTCDGDDRSPPLAWTDPPAGAKSFALVCEDPDAPRGTWVHWLVWGIPASARALSEGSPGAGAREGTNDFRKTGWGGPCPPPGPAHRYFFRLSALDTTLDLAPGATKAALEKAMEGHVVGRTELTGRYARR